MDESARESLLKKIMVLNEHVWEQRASLPRVESWLRNFDGKTESVEVEQLHALYWLAQFMYFGTREIRVLVRALYRDLFLRPVILETRKKLGVNVSDVDLARGVSDELDKTRFFGVGNPSESGAHILYYFRQENMLQKQHFMDAVQIFSRGASGERKLRKPEVERYVFLDDICGSGDTAVDYSGVVLDDLLALNPSASVSYYCIFATSGGMKRVREESRFGNSCGAVYELDDSYRCLSPKSRYFSGTLMEGIDPNVACRMARHYGNLLHPDYAAGWRDSQMLMGFHHNIPDNTLAMMWWDGAWNKAGPAWTPMFKRYPKV